ncbi:MAG TPA: 4a-hydroxytetrahydrobiopterin dehydratase [Acidimicrobiales bacterium]|nr:4a-hydroxytetrahydrobiopterin dehydratase [Acidimicrobiales bacterium]
MSEVLGGAEVDAALERGHLAWRREDDAIVRVVDCGDFAGALAFVNRVGALAEEADHHPDVDIRWRTVTLHLSTHSAGGVTRRDLELAARIDALDGAEG